MWKPTSDPWASNIRSSIFLNWLNLSNILGSLNIKKFVVKIRPGICFSSNSFNVISNGLKPPAVIKATLMKKESHRFSSLSIAEIIFLPSSALFDINSGSCCPIMLVKFIVLISISYIHVYKITVPALTHKINSKYKKTPYKKGLQRKCNHVHFVTVLFCIISLF